MASIPNYQFFMDPCLKVLSGSGDLHNKVIVDRVSDLVGLTEEQRQMMLQSGRSTTVKSRIYWALAYMKQAGAVGNPKRGFYCITERGESLLTSEDRPINRELLKQFDEFQEFLKRIKDKPSTGGTVEAEDESALSPDEQLSAAAGAIRAEVQSQLLDRLSAVEPADFEQIVVDVLRAMGYGVDAEDAARVTGGVGDEGIDGIIDEDVLGLDSIYVQAKKWSGPVGRPDVQAFVGALQGQNATKGVMISTSKFSAPAQEYAEAVSGCRIVLIDGEKLSGLMYDHGVGVSDATTVATRKLDTDYFPDEYL